MKTPFAFRLWGILLLLAATGCKEAVFNQPQPPNRWNRSAFPKSWQGTWQIPESTSDESETLHIASDRAHSEDESVEFVLGENTILRHFGGHFVLSARKADEEQYNVYLARRKRDTLAVFYLDAEDDAKVAVWDSVLNADVDRTLTDEGEVKSYLLAPENNAAFRALMREGGFTHAGDFIRIRE